MMKRTIRICFCLILYALLCVSESMAQTNVPSVYADEFYSSVIIAKSDSLLIYQIKDSVCDSLDLKAVCEVKMINNEFAECQSVGGSVYSAFRDVRHSTKPRTTDSNDSTIIKLLFPNCPDRIFVELYSGGRSFDKQYVTDGKCIFKSATRIGSLLIFIYPAEYQESTPISQYFGLLCFTYDSDNYHQSFYRDEEIEIKFESISAELFNQFFIMGEYVRFINDGIVWRSFFYHRCNEQEIIERISPRLRTNANVL